MKDSFPTNTQFFIGLRDTDLVLDVAGGSQEAGAHIILYTQKQEDNDNQKWVYEDNQIRNVKTGLALTFPNLTPNVAGDQQHVQGSETQKFEYYDYTISAKANEDLVVGILGAATDGARVALIPRDNDSELQQWTIL
ncbi:hypothetical protein BGZ68_001630 [Mortierella alpina]|nr:hypothetical protein BGZ68_001630 [Mortierella alpina]